MSSTIESVDGKISIQDAQNTPILGYKLYGTKIRSNQEIKESLNNFDAEVPLTEIYPRYFVMCRDKWPIVSDIYTPPYYISDYTSSQIKVAASDLEPSHSIDILKMPYKCYKKYGPFAYDISSGLQVILSNSKDDETYSCSLSAEKVNIDENNIILVLTSWNKELDDEDIITFSLMNDSSDTVSKTDVAAASSSIQPFNFVDDLNNGSILGAAYSIIDVKKINSSVDFLTEYDYIDETKTIYRRSTTATLRGENSEIFSGCWTIDESTQMPKFSLSTMQENLGAVTKYDYELCSKASVCNYATLVSEDSLSNNTFCIRDNGDVIFYFEEYRNNLSSWREKITDLANSNRGLTLSLFFIDQQALSFSQDDYWCYNCYGRNPVLTSNMYRGFNTFYILASSSFISDGYYPNGYSTSFSNAQITYEIDNELTEKLSNLKTQVKNVDKKSLVIVDKYSDLASYIDIQEGQKALVLNDEYKPFHLLSESQEFIENNLIENIIEVTFNRPDESWVAPDQTSYHIAINNINNNAVEFKVTYTPLENLFQVYLPMSVDDSSEKIILPNFDMETPTLVIIYFEDEESSSVKCLAWSAESSKWCDLIFDGETVQSTFVSDDYLPEYFTNAIIYSESGISEQSKQSLSQIVQFKTQNDLLEKGYYQYTQDIWQKYNSKSALNVMYGKKITLSTNDFKQMNLKLQPNIFIANDREEVYRYEEA